MNEANRRVVVTGLGTVNPLGKNVKDFWTGIKEGRSGVGPITKFDVSDYPSKIAGEVKDFDPGAVIDGREARRMDRFTQYALVAATEAVGDARLDLDNIDHERFGVVLGNGIGGMKSLEDAYFQLYEKGPRRIPIMTIPKLISNIAPGQVAMRFGLPGPGGSLARRACECSGPGVHRYRNDGPSR